MTENLPGLPCLIELNESVNTIHLIEENIGIPVTTNGNINVIQTTPHNNTIQEPFCFDKIEVENVPTTAVLFEVVYPEELNLKPVQVKRGRPKKKKLTEITPETQLNPPRVPPLKSARTRSGRLVKLPKYIEKDFKKIEITDEPEIKTTEFVRIENEKPATLENDGGLQFHQRKRTFAQHYRCPKCKKAYLGRNKMIQHIKKYPDHGPLPEGYSELNFDVWNYLVEITQKCPSGQRGVKFCEELTNLLHNVQLLRSALFKNCDEDQKKSVQIDKVLGNAIGLSPGSYNFDENELYKDVTVFQLISNSEFFNPSKTVGNNEKKEQVVEESKTESREVFTNKEIVAESPSGNKNIKNLDNLLGDNSLLNSLPHNAVEDELMLTGVVDTSANLLDNSTSSDEVMNVDQFVNERFKKITEPEIELSGGSLNLGDLPSLDLFQFHTN